MGQAMSIWSRLAALEKRVNDLEYEQNVPMMVQGTMGGGQGSYPIRWAVLELLTANNYVLRPGSDPKLERIK
jgi:hypothetical protein